MFETTEFLGSSRKMGMMESSKVWKAGGWKVNENEIEDGSWESWVEP